MQVKVCGMTRIEQVNALNDLNVDFVGFIFYEKSPRYVLNHLSKNDIKSIKGDFKKAGVFVNASKDFILNTVRECSLDMVQLHGDETPGFVKSISSEITVIKAFGVNDNFDFESALAEYSDAADYFLFDTSSKNYGGTGKKFDWNILQNPAIAKPYFLSGGISMEDAEEILSLTKTEAGKYLFSLDINSKFETAPGNKDVRRIAAFLKEVKI